MFPIARLHFGCKGTVSGDGFGFWLHVRLVLGLNVDGAIYFFRCSNDFVQQKVYLLMQVYVSLIMFAAYFCQLADPKVV